MTEKPKRRRWTQADKLAKKAERVTRLKVLLADALESYNTELKDAHAEAKAQAAALPPLD